MSDQVQAEGAVLLLHGFGGEPFEMQGLARAFQAAGWESSTPLLPGHGESLEALQRTGWNDWVAAAEAEYLRMSEKYEKVFAAGLSMGGSLALELAARHDPAGVIVIAAPVFLYRFYPWTASDWRLPLVPLLKRFRPVWSAKPRNPESCEIAPWKGYEDGIALGPLESFMLGLKALRGRLGEVTAPLLAMHCPEDETAPAGNAWEIAVNVSSRKRRIELLAIDEQVTGKHCLTTHVETCGRVEKLAVDFVREISANVEG